MLEINSLSKSYGRTRALSDLSVSFECGVYGLLGPNGAGKSTFMNILTDNIPLTSGEVRFEGKSICPGGRNFRAEVGYMPQYCEMIPEFSCIDFLRYMAVLKGVRRDVAEKQIASMLKRFDLDGVAKRKISTFSGGMKQRLMLIQAFLGDPKLILLDEPTAGLDPAQRVNMKSFISEMSRGRIIIIATHIISDIEQLASGVLCLKQGRNIFFGTPAEMLSLNDGTLEDAYMLLYGEKDAYTV